MRFRPCIDIHNGKVKQIVGGTLRDTGDQAQENYVSEMDACYYAGFYEKAGLWGGHMILLNAQDSPWYEDTKKQALQALAQYPGRWQVGGGIRPENAAQFLDAGAAQVIVTSYVFCNGEIDYGHLERLVREVGKDRLVLDLSCRAKGEAGTYYIVTDRWQKFTRVRLDHAALDALAGHCGEFLIHAADVEGRAKGIERELVSMLGAWQGIPVTYAGGVGSLEDLKLLKKLGQNRLDVTVGSALDLFGGMLSFEEILKLCEN